MNPACTDSGSSTWKPVNAYAAAPISSKNTNIVKMSPAKAKPSIPVVNNSISDR